MTGLDAQRGVALLAVLGIILALLPLTAAICLQTQLDGLMQRNTAASSQAFYAAEAGLAHAVAEIPPSASLATLLHGADGLEGTADDGQFAFRSPPPVELSYQVRVTTAADGRICLQSTGHGLHGAQRELETIVAPSATPFTPAALYVEADAIDLDLGAGGFLLSGLPAGDGSGGASAVAGIALTSTAAAEALRSTLPPAQVDGSGGAPSLVATAALDLGAYTTLLRQRLDAVILSGAPLATGLGTEAQPQLTIVDGDWAITDDTGGFGILVVHGSLEIDAELRYGGLVVVTGELNVADDGDVGIDGALWLGVSGTAEIDLVGAGSIRYAPGILERAAAALAGAFLHRAEVTAWRELS